MILTSVLLVLLAILGAPLFSVIAASAMFGFSRDDTDLIAVAVEVLGIADLQFLAAIPLFTFAGFILSESQAPHRLVRLTGAVIGWMPAGLAVVALATCALFTAFTGASGVTIIALGALLFPALLEDGYPERFNLGLSFNNIGGAGFDFTATRSEIDRVDTTYDMTYVSVGKTLGPKVYLSLDYVNALSIFHFDDGDGGSIEVRPESDRYSLSLNANLNRTFSLLLVGEWMEHDDFEEIRALTGLTIRF